MRFLALILVVWAWMVPAAAQDNPSIEDVIGQQLQAFNDRDVDTAWSFASPMIQGMFGTPGRFGNMVQNGYPMVWDNREASFLELEDDAGTLTQRVFIRDTDGAGWLLVYDMIQTPDGWKINGVDVLPAPELAA